MVALTMSRSNKPMKLTGFAGSLSAWRWAEGFVPRRPPVTPQYTRSHCHQRERGRDASSHTGDRCHNHRIVITL
jgi:hypothetical protein